jgi:hypothetical protein
MFLIAFVVLMVAGFYLEKVEWKEGAIWTTVAFTVSWLLFRRQDIFAASIGIGVVDLFLALRIFGRPSI